MERLGGGGTNYWLFILFRLLEKWVWVKKGEENLAVRVNKSLSQGRN